jgi:N-acetylglucosaminyl-diphospho-decaprenol L-rhamnosyltransferase
MADGADVGAVVVNFNAARVIGDCIESLRAEGVAEIVVTDNASADDSRQVVGDSAVWLPTGANLGLGGGANRGVAALAPSTEYLLICNPDVILAPGAVKAMAAVLDADPAAGIVGPRVENPDGTVYPTPRIFPGMLDAVGHAFVGFVKPDNQFTRRYRMLDVDRSAPSPDVDWVSGSCFMARRAAWEQLGGFDESYFMYAEDVDLCWRAKAAGWRVAFEPAARVVHLQGHSTDQRAYRMIVRHHLSLWKFSARTVRGPQRALLPLVAVGLAVRAALACGQRAVRRLRNR